MNNSRIVQPRITRLLVVSAIMFGVWLTAASVPALATIQHSYISSFNGADAPGGPFSIVLSDAIDSSTGASVGDVYVAEYNLGTGASVVDKFNENGGYAGLQVNGSETPRQSFALLSSSSFLTSGIAVDSSGGSNRGDVYIADVEGDVVDKFSEAGTYLCQITGSASPSASECDGVAGSDTPAGSLEPTGVAVNASGELFVADAAHDVIDKFAASGAYVGQIADSHITSPASIAIDSLGDLYVTNASLAALLGGESSSFDVVKFDAAGAFVSVLDNNAPESVAVDPSTNHVFVFGGAQEPQQITEYDATGRELDGFGAGRVSSALGIAVSGLNGQIYVGEVGLFGGAAVDIFGAGITVPNVTTGLASDVQPTSATLQGQVDPDAADGGGSVTSCEFEYGTSTAYGKRFPCSPAAPYSAATDVEAVLGGLAPDTVYHFRLVVANTNGGDVGTDETFTTPGPPTIGGEPAEARTRSATLRAQIDPFGRDSTCEVQYVDEAAFQSAGFTDAMTQACAPVDLGSGFGDQNAAVALSGLQIGSTYHYRFVAVNQVGTTIGAAQTFATFGINAFAFEVLNENKQPYTQAGGHPYELTTSFSLNTTTDKFGRKFPDANLKDVEAELPVGLVGNVNATPRCTPHDVTHNMCSGSTQVGVLVVSTTQGTLEGGLYNLTPPAGVPAEFGARLDNLVNVFIDPNVRNGQDYGITAYVDNASAQEGITGSSLTLWGVPADPSHDAQRECPRPSGGGYELGCASGAQLAPLLTNPTSCSTEQTTVMRADAWQEPGDFVSATSTGPGVTGCERLSFHPRLTVRPDTASADSPSGMAVDLHVPQNEAVGGLATPSLKDAVVTLPEGVTINPAAANGLQACTLAEIGLGSSVEPACPDASKVGSVEVETPLLSDHLKGAVYLAEQNNNPFGSLLALYVTAAADGVSIKLAGKVEADPQTGQLTATFENTPQLPFENFKLEFFGGPRAPLVTPASCGVYTTTSSLTPWSAPESEAPASPSASFQITSGPGGAPCAPQGFAPSFVAGSTGNDAGAFSPFTLAIARNDGEQSLSTISTLMPPGLLGMISRVSLCGEAQANEGACSSASKVGHVTVGVGSGPDPLVIPQSGKPEDGVFLTGPYKGAPFGLSIVVPAEAGPFDLDENGRPVVVRAAIEVDRDTAQVRVLGNPLPLILRGIPVDMRSLDVVIDRPEFMVNPTNCEKMQVVGTLGSGQGASANLASPFEVTNCAALAFKPKLQVTTSGKSSRANGASLTVKLTYPKTLGGTEADIAKVKVELPKRLPSRLKTLQKACAEQTFAANPANCPPASKVGVATAKTPVLPVAMIGPVYFVSHGGARFPELVFVLQGDNVTIDLHAETFISKKGITSSILRRVPDVPVSSFELKLPKGPYSALAANGDLCKGKLLMPTEFLAQNGAVLRQRTKIAPTGCPRRKR